MRLRVTSAALVAAALAGCGDDTTPTGGGTPDGGRRPPPECPPGPNVCGCADNGPADFSRAMSGMATASADEAQREALVRTNHWRTAAGVPAVNGNAQLEQAATAHSRFMATNPSSCWPGAHYENAGSCAGFTGRTPGERIMAAGYRPAAAGEVINWNASAQSSIDGWIWTVYHRTPFQDPGYTEVGFAMVRDARGRANNTMEFARAAGTPAPALTDVSVFPPPGADYVPAAFQGNLEGPTPPVPTSTRAWPSGQVVSLMFPTNTFTITSHRLLDGRCNEVTHSTFRAPNAPSVADSQPDSNNRNPRFVFLYADRRLEAATRYTVEVRGTVNDAPWHRVWSFTTSP